MNKSTNESSSQQQTLEDTRVPDTDEPDFFEEELGSDTDDDATPSEPSALDDLDLFRSYDVLIFYCDFANKIHISYCDFTCFLCFVLNKCLMKLMKL